MTAIYLIARYGRRDELQAYAQSLIMQGHQITSTWVTAAPVAVDDGLCPLPPHISRTIALTNAADLYTAGMVIAFTELPGSPHSRGGRHVEWGLACQAGKDLVVIGPCENVFYHLTDDHFPSFAACLGWLGTQDDPQGDTP